MLAPILFLAAFIPLTIVLSVLAIVMSRVEDSGLKANRSGVVWSNLVLRLGRVRVRADLSAIEPGQTYIFVVNHQSLLDIPVLYGLLGARLKGRKLVFIAKDSLYRVPIFGKALARAGHISIDRDNSRQAMRSIDRAAASARAGTSIVVFPEGTRSRDVSHLADFKIGAMILALKCGVPVVPVVMAGTAELLPRDSMLLRPGSVDVRVLPPVDVTGRYSLKDRDLFKDDLWQSMNSAYVELYQCRTTASR